MTGRRNSAILALIAALAVPPLAAQEAPAATQDSGAYLAARAAMRAGDFPIAGDYLLNAISADPGNPALFETAMAAYLGAGALENAAPLAAAMADIGANSQLSAMLRTADAARQGDWAAILGGIDGLGRVSPLVDALSRGWAQIGAGDSAAGLAAFDAVIAEPRMRAFGLFHKAMALASMGDLEGAAAIFADPAAGGIQRSRRALVAHAQILALLDQKDAALALLEQGFPTLSDPVAADLHARISAGDTPPWTLIRSPVEGLAEVYFSVAGAIINETDDVTVLFHLRIAQWLDPRNADAALLTAQVLERLEQYPLAQAAYDTVPPEQPAFVMAEIGRANAQRLDGRLEAGIETLSALTRARPDNAAAQGRLGDFLRADSRLGEALTAYDRALTLLPAAEPGRWRLLYSRAITHHALDDWPAAEADFEAVLALVPDQPSVLNYYGYSLVERHERLDEALAMIERAVAGDPQNGAIIDSLGWALYRLGRYSEAVAHLERAAALEPGDAVVNDHLGDVYWRVGREREARFQWSRALSFHPEEAEAAKIRAKLENGMVDPAEEAAAAERVATGG